MGSAYILTIIDTGTEYAYTTLTALCNAHDRDVLNVSRQHLNVKIKQDGYFENKYIKVKKYIILTNKDVLKTKGLLP